MASSFVRVGSALFLAVFVAAGLASCGGGGSSGSAHGGTGASGSGASGSGSSNGGASGSSVSGTTGSGITLASGSGGNGTGGSTQGLAVTPTTLQTLAVTAGQTTPTVTFNATLDGSPIAVAWGVDLGNVGTITAGSASAGVFSPSGTAGGLVTISAGLNGQTVQRQVLVQLSASQNGPSAAEQGQVPTTTAQLTAGGGVGGVGGEGLGPAVTDMPTLTALGAPADNGQAKGLGFLYPYDKTVWPRGLLAPLLMWTWSTGDADAIQIGLSTANGSFTWTGTFGKPAILGTTGKLIRSPIPQDVWDMATNSAGGAANPLTMTLTVAKGGVASGPITQTWTIAPARLSGTIYYQSYGTQLAKNYSGAVGGNGQFGGAVLSIHVGDTGPKLAAGTNTANSGCRVCHSVAAQGTRLIVQHGDSYGTSSAYDLAPAGNTEHVMTHDATYPAVYPDGSLTLTEGGQLLPLPTDTTPLTTTGLTTAVTDLGTPAFSPDGTMIAFNPLAGPSPLVTQQTLYVMSFAKATSTFSGLTLIAKDTAPARLGWPAFFPDSKSVVYHRQTQASACSADPASTVVTRSGARAQIYWTDLAGPGSVTPLDALNGKGYLPKLAAAVNMSCTDACSNQVGAGATAAFSNNDHGDDVNVNYEPTVNPIASGGYAWVVFTSRRMYGNEATIGSFCSDPRGGDLVQNITPKKLWVAAVDLTQAPGTDASHPAFYLPAQELLAGNARGFWALDPCEADGTSCTTGDQCCNGYCEPNGAGGALVCSTKPPDTTCSMTGDKCSTAADCCTATDKCINGFCAQASPG